MRPNDGQAGLILDMRRLLATPGLDGEHLGRVVFTLDRFVRSGLITQTEADEMLADRQQTRIRP